MIVGRLISCLSLFAMRLLPVVVASVYVIDTVAIAPLAAADPTIAGDGTYLVGTDIRPGTYRSAPSESGLPCQWWTLAKLGDLSSQTGFDSSSGQTYATIHPTDAAFHTQFCQTWQKVG